MSCPIMIKVVRNSSSEEVLGWKCINLMDMNLEVRVHNGGRDMEHIRSRIELCGERGGHLIENLYPHGVHPLGPDQTMSFYCSVDDNLLDVYLKVRVFDDQERQYEAPITGRMEPAT